LLTVCRALDGKWKENRDQMRFIVFIPSLTNRQTPENVHSSHFMKYGSKH